MSGAARSRLGGGWSAEPIPAIVEETTVTFTLGVDIACRAPHQASLAAADGRILWSGHRFRTEIADLERLWARLPEAARAGAVRVVMEPTRNAWVALAAWFRRHGATVVLVPPDARPTCAPTTPSTPNPTDLTRCCWPGCRCFIPTGCTRSRAWDREMRCGGRPSCTPPWPTVHSSPGTGSRGSGSDRINSDACPAATRRALRAWARSTSIPLCAPTIPTHAEPDRRREVSRARFWQPRAPAVGLADKKYGPKRRPSCRPGR
jgi:hypothetical protein